jgi:hypothetical protein
MRLRESKSDLPSSSTQPAERSMDGTPSHRALVLLLLIIGAALRLWQWAAGGSLWLDEIALTRNILARSVVELVTIPLAFDQVAPPGFLVLEKLSTLAFGDSERALWLLPLLAGLAGLFLFRTLAEEALRGTAVVLAIAMFALGLPLIRYSGEVKQYGLDAAAAVALTLLALSLRHERTLRDRILIGVCAFAIILFSQASAVVMAGLGGALLVLWLLDRDPPTRSALLTTIPLWATASVVAVLMGARSMTASTRAFMQAFWNPGFLPRPVQAMPTVRWLWQRVVDLFGDPWTLRYDFPWFFAILALLGLIALWRQKRTAALLIAAPMAATLLAAIAHQYPFRSRLIVFLVPGAILATAAGAGWIADLASRRSALLGALVGCAFLLVPVKRLIEVGIPAHVDNYHPIYRHLQANRQPNDAVYVSFLANSSAIYYGPRYGLARPDFQLSVCDQNDVRRYLRDLDQFRGRPRVWFVAKHVPPFRAPLEASRRYLSTIGVRRDSLSVPSAVHDALTLELYDLSDARRLRTADAETFAVTAMTTNPKPGCRDWSGEAAVTAQGAPLR